MITEVLTLTELSGRVDVDVDHLQRMIRIGSLPEAVERPGPDGPVWVIPADRVQELVTRFGWTLRTVDLTTAEPMAEVSPGSPSGHQATTAAESPDIPIDDAAPGAAGAGEPDGIEGRELVPHGATTMEATTTGYHRTDEEITVAEIIDGVLLNRLLEAHEDRAEAEARARESQRAMTALASGQQRLVRELSEERYERQRSADRLRDERSARMVADAKLAELRSRVDREQVVAEQERQARVAATRRSIEAEQEAALAVASLGWLARRRYQRRVDQMQRPTGPDSIPPAR